MTTLSDIRTAIILVLDDSDYGEPTIDDMINDALQAIAGGILMPSTGFISTPLNDLHTIGTVDTVIDQAFTPMPDDYQRGLFSVSDSSGALIYPPTGGDYSDFKLFMDQTEDKSLAAYGSVFDVAIKGTNLYYQGIPDEPETLIIQYYKTPDTMSSEGDEPEGLPSHMAKKLLKHHVCMEIFGEGIEDGEDSSGRGYSYHSKLFYAAMETLLQANDVDEVSAHYGGSEDRIS